MARRTTIKRAILSLELFLVLLANTATLSNGHCSDTDDVVGVKGANDTYSGRLVNDLLDAYGPGFSRPVLKNDHATTVVYRLLIHELIELSTVDQYISISANLKMSWKDEYLQWNPSEYGGVQQILIPASSIWQPDITLQGNINEGFEVMKPTAVRVAPDGQVEWYTPAFLTSSCPVHIRNFPFDAQRCELRFSSWSFTNDKIDLRVATGEEAEQTSYTENGIWDLKEVQTSRELVEYVGVGIYSEVSYVMILKRRSEYYTTNIIAPFIFLSLLANLSFLLPPDGKDGRITLSVTTLLAMVVFLQIVAGAMPPTGETPILANYFLILIILVCLSIVAMIIVYYVQCNTYEPPRWFKRVVLGFMAKAVFLYDETAAGVTGKDDGEVKMEEVNANMASPPEQDALDIPASLLEDVNYLRKNVEMQDLDDQKVYKWQQGSRVINRWLLIISTIIWAVATIVLLVQSSTGDDGTGNAD